MKWLFASDIHGSAYYCVKLILAFEREKADRFLLLGDILYHGPRNDLPLDYAPKKVMPMLNSLKDVIFAVRGNCDGEVDQMVLEFPILADYAVICQNGLAIYATHGHKYGEVNPPPMAKGSVLLCGHTHIPAFNEHDGFIYMNPGSVSIPKMDSAHGYMIMEDRTFIWKDLDGAVISSHTI